jgi:hypothetical protein
LENIDEKDKFLDTMTIQNWTKKISST